MRLWRLAIWERKGKASRCNEWRSGERSGKAVLEEEMVFLGEDSV
jgi:hypothetical protein